MAIINDNSDEFDEDLYSHMSNDDNTSMFDMSILNNIISNQKGQRLLILK